MAGGVDAARGPRCGEEYTAAAQARLVAPPHHQQPGRGCVDIYLVFYLKLQIQLFMPKCYLCLNVIFC